MRSSSDAFSTFSCSSGLKPLIGPSPGVARDRTNDPPLLWGVSQNFGVGDDVVSMAVVSVTVHVVADLVQHGCRREPFAILRRKLVDRLQRRKQQQSRVAHVHGMMQVDPVMFHGALDRLPAL